MNKTNLTLVGKLSNGYMQNNLFGIKEFCLGIYDELGYREF
jgi:hypothetical protein